MTVITGTSRCDRHHTSASPSPQLPTCLMSFTAQFTGSPATSFRNARRWFMEAIPSPARMGYYRFREIKRVIPAPRPDGVSGKAGIQGLQLRVERRACHSLCRRDRGGTIAGRGGHRQFGSCVSICRSEVGGRQPLDCERRIHTNTQEAFLSPHCRVRGQERRASTAKMDLIGELGGRVLPYYVAGFVMVGDSSASIRRAAHHSF